MSKWIEVNLGEGIEVKHGFSFKGEYFSDEGERILITPGNFYEEGGFKYTPGKEKFYLGDFPKEYVCSKDDLVVAMTEQTPGLLGSTALVPEDHKFLHNQRIGLISFDQYKYDRLFLYYLFQTQWVRKQIALSSSGSKVKHTSPKRIYDVKIQRPPLPVQREIGKLLFSLDAKIEVNNKINQELEAIAKVLYEYWFVQFDFPIDLCANLIGAEGYKTSGGKMVFNEVLKREIPDGWEVKELGEICEVLNGYAFKSEWYKEDGVRIIRTKNFEDGYINLNDVNYLEKEFALDFEKYQLNQFDFLMVMVGASTGKHCIVNSNILPALQNQNMWRFVSKTNSQLFLNLKLRRIILELENTTNGSARGFFQKDTFLSKKIEIPSKLIINEFCSMVNSTYSKIDTNLKENQKLVELRDWLLPMLMNGQVTVGEAEEKLAMVAEERGKYGEV